MASRIPVLVAVWIAAAGLAKADTITIDDVKYENVLVRESSTTYYVQLPEEGRTISAPKSEVDPANVVLSKDKAARQALHEQWKRTSALRPKPEGSETETKPLKTRPPIPPARLPKPPASPEKRGAVERVKSAAGGVTIEKETSTDDRGVRRLVLKGNRQKEEGFEGRVEQQRQQESLDRMRAQEDMENAVPPMPEMPLQGAPEGGGVILPDSVMLPGGPLVEPGAEGVP